MITEPTEQEDKLLRLYLRFYRLQSLAALQGLRHQGMLDLSWFWPKEKREKLAKLKQQCDEIRTAVIELEGLTP